MTPEMTELLKQGVSGAAMLAGAFIVKRLMTPMAQRSWSTALVSRRTQREQIAMIPEVLQRITEVGTRVALVEGRSWAHCEFDRNDAIFETDASGAWLRVNREMTAKTGRGSDELLGYQWLNILADADRARVRAEWHDAVMDGRDFEQQCLMNTRGVNHLKIVIHALPVRRPCDKSVVGYNGRLYFVKKEDHRAAEA